MIKIPFVLLLLALVLPVRGQTTAASAKQADRPRIILDTDLGNDVDDAGTLAVLHALADKGEIEILAIGIVNGHPAAVPLADAINTFFGRPDVPMGSIANKSAPIHDNTFKMDVIAKAYPHKLTQETAPDVVDLYRRILAAQPDRSVTLVVIGQATNVANLLRSKGDKHSELTGVELMRNKIKFYAAGGNGRGTLPKGLAGWNYTNDKASAAYELENLPADFPTVFAGGSGNTLKLGSGYRNLPENHIIRKCYEAYFKEGTAQDRPTWDQLRLLYGVRESYREHFEVSPPGSITMDTATGTITWSKEPNHGRSYAYIKPERKSAAAKELEALMMHMPKVAGGAGK